MPRNFWSLVLAAGAGRRLASITGGVPKQYWRADDGRTLLEDTLDRLAPVCAVDQTVIVVDASHQSHLADLGRVAAYPHVIAQPCDRGTAAGVLLGLIEIAAHAPDAIVLLSPSDHGVDRPDLFAAAVRDAARTVEADAHRVVIFGAMPTHPEQEYGWITPTRRTDSRGLHGVATFVEKPGALLAKQLFATGAVWNTMVLVARVGTLLDLYRQHLPTLAHTFLHALTLAPSARRAFFAARYEDLLPRDFSRDLLGHAEPLSLSMLPVEAGWSDLGTPDRMRHAGRLRTAPVTSAPAARVRVAS